MRMTSGGSCGSTCGAGQLPRTSADGHDAWAIVCRSRHRACYIARVQRGSIRRRAPRRRPLEGPKAVRTGRARVTVLAASVVAAAVAFRQLRIVAPVRLPQDVKFWNGDLHDIYYPGFVFAYRGEHVLPRWNPWQLAGSPFLAGYKLCAAPATSRSPASRRSSRRADWRCRGRPHSSPA